MRARWPDAFCLSLSKGVHEGQLRARRVAMSDIDKLNVDSVIARLLEGIFTFFTLKSFSTWFTPWKKCAAH